jgi:hypothetical protein
MPDKIELKSMQRTPLPDVNDRGSKYHVIRHTPSCAPSCLANRNGPYSLADSSKF